MAFIELKNLSKNYGAEVPALSRVTFSVEQGEWVAVMGPSGSGKSTLLNILGCLDSPTSGEAWIDGEDLARFPASELARFRAEKVGFVFQAYHLLPYLTAIENVMLAQYFHSLADEAEAADALKQVGLGERLHHLPSQLSGGEQQRVCVARALINQPNLILADEPTGNLDEVNEAIVMGLVADLHREGHTILMVTHDPEIGRMAERRIELHHGRVMEVSTFHTHEEDLVDTLLEAIWHGREDSGQEQVSAEALPEFTRHRAMFSLLGQQDWISMSEGRLAFTRQGELRARQAIRRHRLAERLFYDTFGMDEDQLHESAHKIEHSLSKEVTDKICTFLRHPKTCPHGSPIPRGECCALNAGVHS